MAKGLNRLAPSTNHGKRSCLANQKNRTPELQRHEYFGGVYQDNSCSNKTGNWDILGSNQKSDISAHGVMLYELAASGVY